MLTAEQEAKKQSLHHHKETRLTALPRVADEVNEPMPGMPGGCAKGPSPMRKPVMDLVEGAFCKHELSAPGRNRGRWTMSFMSRQRVPCLPSCPVVSLPELGMALARMARSEHGSGMSFMLLSLTHLRVSRAQACL